MTTALKENKKCEADISEHSTSEKYLTFCLGNESYGLAVVKVREIIRMQNITCMPQMPAYLKGVINLRGKVIPVLDLRARFELPGQTATESTCIIVVQARLKDGSDKMIGLIVDSVDEVLNILESEIEEAPEFGCRLSVNYISGMAKVKGGVKTLLDIDKVISETEIE